MPKQIHLDRELLEAALYGLEHKRREMDQRILELRGRLGGGRTGAAASASGGRKKRTMSAAARKRIAEAQRKRWAELKAKKAAGGKK
jgi:hypothetical protein